MGDAKTRMSPEGAMAIGIIVGLLSTCVQSVGLTLQRKSHMLEDEKEDHVSRRPPYRRRRWQVGMLLFLVANIIGSTIQIVALPLPLLSTLQASGLVFNSAMASLLLKEPWTLRTGYGTVLVAAGAILISYFSAMPEPSHDLQQLLRLLSMRGFLVWFILSLVFVLAVVIMTFVLRRCISSQRSESPKTLLVNGMAFGLVSGVLSAHALLLAKSAVELIVRSLTHHQNQFKTFKPWLLVLAFLFFSLSQLYYLHHGLKLISTSILYPFVFCVYNIVAILDGLIYFQQMDRLPPLHAGLISLGTVLLLAGVFALSWRLQDDEDEDHHTVKAEIPQTVLAPGMGFVGEPDSDTNESGSVYDDDDDELDEDNVTETTSLVRKPLPKSQSTQSKVPKSRSKSTHTQHSHHTQHPHKRRRRAATLKEVQAIWGAVGESDDRYGTFERPSSSTSHPIRPTPGSPVPPKRRRRSTIGRGLGAVEDPEADAETPDRISRSSTLPGQSPTVRRRSSYHSGALFSDLLKGDWWLFKRKEKDDHLDDGNEQRPLNNHGRQGPL